MERVVISERPCVCDSTPLWQLTVGEFRDLVASEVESRMRQRMDGDPSRKGDATGRWLVYGLNGLMELIGCSKSHAYEIKASGILDEAITQHGRRIIIDAEHALRLLRERGTHASNIKKRNQ